MVSETDNNKSKISKDSEEFEEELAKHFKEMIEKGRGKCCVCHHDLDIHIDEEDVWRCHSLGADGYQCECALRKNRAEADISYYDLSKRAEENFEDLKEKLAEFDP
jgi:hypothetical protein